MGVSKLDDKILEELNKADTIDLLYLLYDLQERILKILIERQT